VINLVAWFVHRELTATGNRENANCFSIDSYIAFVGDRFGFPQSRLSCAMSQRAPFSLKVFAARFAFFFCIWLTVADWKIADAPVGVAASVFALWISLTLMPPGDVDIRLVPLAKLTFRLLSCSIIAGVDVARRALLPRLDLNPGLVAVPLTLEPGDCRNLFLLYQSLQPGSLPAGAESGQLQVHCLDVGRPVIDGVAADEDLFKKAIGRG
jgi:multicomponent Na+:H+ antiporter subunit E